MRKIATLIGVIFLSGCTMTLHSNDPMQEALRATKARISQMKVIKTEEQLTHDILQLRRDNARLKLEMQAPPVIEGQFIPTEELPEQK